MTAQLTKIRATDAQAIINFGLGQAPAIVTRNIKQLGIALPLYQSHGVPPKPSSSWPAMLRKGCACRRRRW